MQHSTRKAVMKMAQSIGICLVIGVGTVAALAVDMLLIHAINPRIGFDDPVMTIYVLVAFWIEVVVIGSIAYCVAMHAHKA